MIIFSSVTRKFGDEIVAVNDLSFEVDNGEMVLITGPSGSGKTTIMRLLIKHVDPSEGKILFNDQALEELTQVQIPFHRRKIGVVFQDYKLLEELNIWENIALPLYIAGKNQTEIEERVTDVLKLVNMADRAFAFPSQLSGGESQRIGIARALATAPKVIFADEPTGNLDSETTKTIVRLLQKINELGTTVLLATHDKNVLDLLSDIKCIKLVKNKKASSDIKDDSSESKDSDDDQSKQDDEQDKEKENSQEKAKDVKKQTKKSKKNKKKVKRTRFRFKLPEIKLGEKRKKESKEINDKSDDEATDSRIKEE